MNKRKWLFGDYMQAETRVVAWRGPVPQLKLYFQEGRDTHLEIAKVMGQVVQENKISLPNNLFRNIPWQEFTKKTASAERQVGKSTGHSGNYGITKNELARKTGMHPKYAEIILDIYHKKFPGVRQGYQRWIETQLAGNRTIKFPFGWEKVFYDIWSQDLLKYAYATYPQTIVGWLLNQLIIKLCEHFEEIKFTEADVWTPQRIRQCGFDVRLNVHDAAGVSVPDDKELIEYTMQKMKEYAEVPINIDGEELIIPMEFKTGDSWGEAH